MWNFYKTVLISIKIYSKQYLYMPAIILSRWYFSLYTYVPAHQPNLGTHIHILHNFTEVGECKWS